MKQAIIEFLKRRSISYRIEPSVRAVVFPCFDCHNEVSMKWRDSSWYCMTCHASGNLVSLIEREHDAPTTTEIYNPSKEMKWVSRKLSRLIETYESEPIVTELMDLQDRLNQLFSFCKAS